MIVIIFQLILWVVYLVYIKTKYVLSSTLNVPLKLKLKFYIVGTILSLIPLVGIFSNMILYFCTKSGDQRNVYAVYDQSSYRAKVKFEENQNSLWSRYPEYQKAYLSGINKYLIKFVNNQHLLNIFIIPYYGCSPKTEERLMNVVYISSTYQDKNYWFKFWRDLKIAWNNFIQSIKNILNKSI